MYQPLEKESERFLREMVGGAMDDYEIRPPQIDLMKACSGNVEKGGILMAEAGTGTGKTFAYLVPVIISGKKTIVTTRTINLQEQIVSKDLKFLSALRDFPYALAKGRSNYLCLRRLNAYRAEEHREASEHKRLLIWASETVSGDVEDLGAHRSYLWDKVCSDADACRSVKCSYYRHCFYFRARQRWETARIVVTNHALMGINGMLAEDSKILPKAEVLVIDEAHALDQVLSEVTGTTLSTKGSENILNRLLRLDERGTFRGLLSKSPHLFDTVASLRQEMENLWAVVRNNFKDRDTIKGNFKFSDMAKGLSESMKELIKRIRASTTGLFEEDEEIELASAMLKLRAFSEGLEAFACGLEGYVRWTEIERDRVALRISPLYPVNFVRNSIVPEYRSILLTSATLSVAGDFSFISQVLGLDEAGKLSLPSPFDLKKQVAVYVIKGIDLKKEEGPPRLARVIVEEASRKEGGILVLFTSREVMRKTWELCSEELARRGLNPMMQGELANRVMLEAMRESDNSMIFGLDSFWEGVDVKGDSLKTLIITKLPFDVPTEPLVMARTEDIRKRGGDPFLEYSLPRAVLKFRQGFGRLIRSRTDTGRVIVCDERVETRRYGQGFLNSLT